MNPNNQPQTYSVDYLNSISTTPGSNKFDSKLKIIIIALGVLLVIGLVLLFFGMSGGNASKVQAMTAQLKTIETISNTEQSNLQSTKLRAANTSLNIYVKNVEKSIKDLAPYGINPDKLPKDVLAKEKINSDQIKNKLLEAKLNGIYDAVYSQEMTLALGLLNVNMQTIADETSAGKFKSFLEETIKNLETTSNSIKNYNSIDPSS